MVQVKDQEALRRHGHDKSVDELNQLVPNTPRDPQEDPPVRPRRSVQHVLSDPSVPRRIVSQCLERGVRSLELTPAGCIPSQADPTDLLHVRLEPPLPPASIPGPYPPFLLRSITRSLSFPDEVLVLSSASFCSMQAGSDSLALMRLDAPVSPDRGCGVWFQRERAEQAEAVAGWEGEELPLVRGELQDRIGGPGPVVSVVEGFGSSHEVVKEEERVGVEVRCQQPQLLGDVVGRVEVIDEDQVEHLPRFQRTKIRQ
eukprot:1112618-Rhodomonas_salina.1